MEDFAVIDWILVAILAISTLLSFARGFIKEALSLVTWFAAILIARLFAGQVSTLLTPYIELPSIRIGAAYLLLVVGTLIVGGLINRLLCELVKVTGLGGMDKFLGMFFGAGRGMLVVLLVVAGLHYLAPVENDTWWTESKLAPVVIGFLEKYGPGLWEQGGEMIEATMGDKEQSKVI